MRRKKSERMKLIEETESMIFQILKYKRGERCELCGGNKCLGLFHVLPKGAYPRLRLEKKNLLIAGWYCCHLPWHSSFYVARDQILPKVKEILGKDFEDRLRDLDNSLPPLDIVQVQTINKKVKRELRALEREWVHGGE